MLEKPSPRDPAVINDLVRRWREERDERARDELVRRFMPVIKAAGRRFGARYGVQPDDAAQEAALAFLRAIETHDPSIASLETYTHVWARARIGRARRAELPLRVTYGALDDASLVARCAVRLRRRLGRRVTVEEVSAETGLSVARVEDAFAARSLNTLVMSVDSPVRADDEDFTLGDTLAADDAERPDVIVEGASDAAAARAAIDAVLATFVPRHREFFVLHFEKGLSGEECGALMGFNRQRASQIEKQIVARLREALVDHPAALAVLGREPARVERDDGEDGRLLSAKEVTERTGLDRDAIIDMIGKGLFPRAAAKDRRGHRLWWESTVEKWRAQHAARPPMAAS